MPRTERSDAAAGAGAGSGASAGASSTAFKDNIDRALIARLGAALVRESPQFPADRFAQLAADGLDALELKARISQVAAALAATLPESFPAAADVVDALLVAGSDPDDPPGVERDGRLDPPAGLSGWDFWPVAEWVGLAGRGDPELALELLSRVTRHASGEFAIRPFIDDDPKGVHRRLARWVERDDEHVRRLVSEGTRSRLPWAPRLATAEADPSYAVDLLHRLVDDDSEYVRRSVSNHLNDLCKVDPALARSVAGEWLDRAAAARSDGDELRAARFEWVVTRGLRTLVKAGDPDTLRLLGHDPDVEVVASMQVLTPTVRLGEHAEWRVELRSGEAQPVSLIVDYAIRFVRKNGTAGRKVFKWTTFDLAAGASRTLERRHKVAPVTIRTHHAGVHVVEVQVNGTVVAVDQFDLELG